jgi:hypothetical protein
MWHFAKLGAAAVVASAAVLPVAAFAAAPDNLDDAAPIAKASPGLIAPLDYQLGTEMVVRDWVLCVSQSFAETLAKARASGVEAALATYSDLKASKSCGQFPQLSVVLHQSLYAPINQDNAQVFSAAVNISGHWANAFLVEGGLPAEH